MTTAATPPPPGPPAGEPPAPPPIPGWTLAHARRFPATAEWPPLARYRYHPAAAGAAAAQERTALAVDLFACGSAAGAAACLARVAAESHARDALRPAPDGGAEHRARGDRVVLLARGDTVALVRSVGAERASVAAEAAAVERALGGEIR